MVVSPVFFMYCPINFRHDFPLKWSLDQLSELASTHSLDNGYYEGFADLHSMLTCSSRTSYWGSFAELFAPSLLIVSLRYLNDLNDPVSSSGTYGFHCSFSSQFIFGDRLDGFPNHSDEFDFIKCCTLDASKLQVGVPCLLFLRCPFQCNPRGLFNASSLFWCWYVHIHSFVRI